MAITIQADVLRYVIGVLDRLQIPYLVCGSFASGSFGEPRMTLDIDIVVQLTRDSVVALCAEFSDPEFYVSLAAAQEALHWLNDTACVERPWSSGNCALMCATGSASVLPLHETLAEPVAHNPSLPEHLFGHYANSGIGVVFSSRYCGRPPRSWSFVASGSMPR